jgi:hypothetical protein
MKHLLSLLALLALTAPRALNAQTTPASGVVAAGATHSLELRTGKPLRVSEDHSYSQRGIHILRRRLTVDSVKLNYPLNEMPLSRDWIDGVVV